MDKRYDINKEPEPCYRHWGGTGFDRYCEFCVRLNPAHAEVNKLHTRYLRPDHPWFEKHAYEEPPRKYDETIARVVELMNQGYKVKCGYSASSVRGYHNTHIFRMKKKVDKL